MGSRRLNLSAVLVVGVVFMVLSAGTAIWHLTQGEPVDVELGLFFGGLVVAALGLYLVKRRDPS